MYFENYLRNKTLGFFSVEVQQKVIKNVINNTD